MESKGKFYDLGCFSSEYFGKRLENIGFELKGDSKYGLETHYSGIEDTPFGYVLGKKVLLPNEGGEGS